MKAKTEISPIIDDHGVLKRTILVATAGGSWEVPSLVENCYASIEARKHPTAGWVSLTVVERGTKATRQVMITLDARAVAAVRELLSAGTDVYRSGDFYRKACDLRRGDRVDLEKDEIADPDGGEVMFRFEFETVLEVEVETDGVIRVDFESGKSFGFPVEHEVKVDGEQVR